LLSGVPKCRGGAELSLLAVERTTGSLGEEVEEFLRRAEMAHDAEARSSALIAKGFDDTLVALAADGVALEARHDSYIQNL
jgi:hypothetical protein